MRYYSAITGMGIFTPIGKNISETRTALLNGSDGISLIRRFPTEDFTARYAAMISPEIWEELGKMYPDLDQRITMALITAQEAISNSNVKNLSPHRVGLVMGICLGKLSVEDGFETSTNNWHEEAPLLVAKLQYQTHQLAEHLNIQGPAIAISTACASSNHAIGYAQDLLRFGYLDAVVVAGTSEVTPHMFAGFYGLTNMSDAPCAPYSQPIGLNLGEGAGCIVLEKRSVKASDDSSVIGSVAGFGAGSDAYHPTTPHPKGQGVSRAIQSAFQDLGASPEHLGYINTHGTGTHENDLSEWLGIKDVFGEQSQHIHISSNKSFMGHTGGGAGMIESIISLIAMNSDFVPSTLHFQRPRRLIPPGLVSSDRPLSKSYDLALNCNSGFGGSNAALLLAKEKMGAWQLSSINGISIHGVGSVSNYGLDALDNALHGKPPVLTVPSDNIDGYAVPDEAAFARQYDLSSFTSSRDIRFLDPLTSFMLTAATLSQRDAGLATTLENGSEMGIVTAVSHIPSTTLSEFRNSIRNRGVLGISPHAFSRVVMNASMGAVCESLGIKGPSNTIAASEGAGLLAIIQAAMMLKKDAQLKYSVAVAGDELGDIPLAMHEILERRGVPTEGSASVMLSSNPRIERDVQIAGAGLSGSEDFNLALEQALGNHKKNSIDLVIRTDDGNPSSIKSYQQGMETCFGEHLKQMASINPAETMGYADATTSMYAFIQAVQALRRGFIPLGHPSSLLNVSKILVTHSNPINGSIVILLESKSNRS